MPLLRVNQKNVLFIHIPKTGGASVERYLRQHGKLGFFLSDSKQQFYRCTPQHFDTEMLAPLFPNSLIDYRFAFVRHPLDRLVSEYKMRVGGRYKDGKSIPSFEEWFGRVRKRFAEDSRIFDNHINQQIHFVNKFTKVFKFEDGIINNLKQVQSDLGVSFDFSKNFHAQKPYEGVVVEVSTQSIALICDIYASDFEKFGYTLESTKYFKSNT